MSSKVLFVFTSASKNLKGGATGWFLPEAAHPYYVLKPKVDIDFAAPAGPNPPIDPSSVESFKNDEHSVQFLKDPEVTAKLASTKKLSDVSAADYDAVFYIGGHGPVLDLASDSVNAKLASDFYQAGKVTSAVCHGTAALVQATKADGQSIFAGQEVTGFSNAEEIAVGAVETIPFLLEDKVKALGGTFTKADALWGPKTVVSGHLITGQNPASASGVGEAILKALTA